MWGMWGQQQQEGVSSANMRKGLDASFSHKLRPDKGFINRREKPPRCDFTWGWDARHSRRPKNMNKTRGTPILKNLQKGSFRHPI